MSPEENDIIDRGQYAERHTHFFSLFFFFFSPFDVSPPFPSSPPFPFILLFKTLTVKVFRCGISDLSFHPLSSPLPAFFPLPLSLLSLVCKARGDVVGGRRRREPFSPCNFPPSSSSCEIFRMWRPVGMERGFCFFSPLPPFSPLLCRRYQCCHEPFPLLPPSPLSPSNIFPPFPKPLPAETSQMMHSRQINVNLFSFSLLSYGSPPPPLLGGFSKGVTQLLRVHFFSPPPLFDRSLFPFSPLPSQRSNSINY